MQSDGAIFSFSGVFHMLCNFWKTGCLAISILELVFAINVTAQNPKATEQAASVKDAGSTSSPKSAGGLTPSQIFSRSRASVVVIIAADQTRQTEALGSGFVVGQNKIVTNHHVLAGMSQAEVVFSDGSVKPVSNVIADSPEQDLIAVTTQTESRHPLPLGDELTLQQGDSVYALGAPKGLELSFTNGIVSSFRKSNSQFLIQTTAPIAPGSSGGPLFDQAGRVVGVTSSLLADAPGIYFSVGIGDVKRLLLTPQGVVLSLEQWATQQSDGRTVEHKHSQSPIEKNDEPSLQETVSWMASFSEAHGHNMQLEESNLLELLPADSQLKSKQGCTVKVSHKFPKPVRLSPDMKFPAKSYVTVFSLGEMDFSTVQVCGRSQVYVCAETLNSTNTISEIVSYEKYGQPYPEFDRNRTPAILGLLPPEDRGLPYSEHEDSRIVIVFDSQNSTERFANAFKRAVTLCGGSKSAF